MPNYLKVINGANCVQLQSRPVFVVAKKQTNTPVSWASTDVRLGGFSASITADTQTNAAVASYTSVDWVAWYSESWMGFDMGGASVDSGKITTRTIKMCANVYDRQSSTVSSLTLYLCCHPATRNDISGENPKAGLVIRDQSGLPIFQSHRIPIRVLGDVVGLVTSTASIDQSTLQSSFPGGTWQGLDRNYCLTQTAFRVDVGPSDRDYALLPISTHSCPGGAWGGAAMRMFKFEKSGGRAYLWTAAFMPASSITGSYGAYPYPEDLVVGVTAIDVTGA